MRLDFGPLSDVAPSDWLTLLNNRSVHRHMPLAGAQWSADQARDWAAGKDRQWVENGYGPWAIHIDGAFAGWGGFQKEGEDADLGLVLLPPYWGHGAAIYAELVGRGFRDLGLPSITILLPPSRPGLKAPARLGFRLDGEVDYDGHRFLRFRLDRPVAPPAAAT